MDEQHEHHFIPKMIEGLIVDLRCKCGMRPIDIFDEMVLVEGRDEETDARLWLEPKGQLR